MLILTFHHVPGPTTFLSYLPPSRVVNYVGVQCPVPEPPPEDPESIKRVVEAPSGSSTMPTEVFAVDPATITSTSIPVAPSPALPPAPTAGLGMHRT